MLVTKTAKLEDVQNKGQRAVIVAVLAKLSAPISVEDLTKKVQATGQYNGKGTKGHVNSWAMAKAGGDLGSVKYHLRALAAEKRVTLADGVAKPKREKKVREAAPEIAERQEAAAASAEEHAGEPMEQELAVA